MGKTHQNLTIVITECWCPFCTRQPCWVGSV